MSACKLVSAAFAITLAALAFHFEYVSAFSPPFFCSFVAFLLNLLNRMGLSYSSLQPSKFVFSSLFEIATTIWRARGVNCCHKCEKNWKSESFHQRATFPKKNKKTGSCWKNMDNFHVWHEVRKDLLKFFCLQYIRKVLTLKFTTPE